MEAQPNSRHLRPVTAGDADGVHLCEFKNSRTKEICGRQLQRKHDQAKWPKYCYQDGHTPRAAFEQSRREQDKELEVAAAAAEEERAAAFPVTEGIAQFAELVGEFGALVGRVRAVILEGDDLVARVTDAANVEHEITQVRLDADQRIAEAVTGADRALHQVRDAEARRDHAETGRAIAVAATEQALADLDQAREELDQVTAEATQHVAEAVAETERIRAETGRQIAEMSRQLAEARDARARAEQQRDDALETADAANTEIARLRQRLDEVHTAHGQTLAEVHRAGEEAMRDERDRHAVEMAAERDRAGKEMANERKRSADELETVRGQLADCRRDLAMLSRSQHTETR